MIQARNSDVYLNKEMVLSLITEYDIFKFYCHPFVDIGVKFCSELRKDSTPTCSIIPWNGKLLYKDFGNPDDTHDCFSYIQKKYNLTFSEVLKVIDADFGLGLGSSSSSRNQIALTYGKQIVTTKKETVIKIRRREWSKKDEEFWGQFGISKELAIKFGVSPIDYFWINEFRYKASDLAYAYRFEDGRYKIYQPLDPADTKWFSNTKVTDIQGYNCLPEKGEFVFLASSLKDVMTLAGLGYSAIALQGEMLMPSTELIEELKGRFSEVIVLYDNDYNKEDNPGQRMANKICNEYNLVNVILPAHYRSKDISDMVRDHGESSANRVILIQLPL